MMLRPRLSRFVYFTLLAIAGLLVLSYFPLSRIRAANAGATILPSTGKPLVNLKNPQSLQITYMGSADAVAALKGGTAIPTALAASDFNADGAMDVVAGYSTASSSKNGGLLVLLRGNPDAYAPTNLSLYAKAMQGSVPATFLSKASVFAVPESPDLLVTGDFNRDGYQDVLVAARGGALYLLAGDGRGNLLAPQVVPLAGQVTALAVTGNGHVAVSLDGASGPQLVVLAPSPSGLTAGAVYTLPARGDSVAWGNLGGGADVAVGAGANVVVIYNALRANAQTETVNLPFNVQAVALGDFIWDQDNRTEISVLADDGSIHILQHGTLNTAPLTPAQIPGRRAAMLAKYKLPSNPTALGAWSVAKQLPYTGSAPSGAVSPSAFNSPRVASSSTHDLMMLDAERGQLHILDTSGKTASPSADVSFSGAPVAALALPQKINSDRDIIVLTSAQSAPMLVTSGATLTLNVNTTADIDTVNACTTSTTTVPSTLSLREAVCIANNSAPDTATINIGAGTYDLTSLETGELQVGTGSAYSLSIISSGTSSNTIIQQTDGHDRIIEQDPNFSGDVNITIENVTVQLGTCSASGIDCSDGGGFLLGGGPNGAPDNLTLTNVIVNDNTAGDSTLGENGGAMQLSDDGTYIFTNCTFSNNTAVYHGGTQDGGGAGGAINVTNGDNDQSMTLTNCTFTGNTAQNGGGGAVYSVMSETGSLNVSGSTFTGNSALDDASDDGAFGGAILADGDATISNSRIAGNTAADAGEFGTGLFTDDDSPFSVVATNNWWGCNGGPGASGCQTVVTTGTGALTTNPWLVLGITPTSTSPVQLSPGGTTTLTADLTHNSNGTGGFSVPNGTPVSFAATLGTDNPTSSTLTSGQATSTYTAGSTAGNDTATATVDNQTVPSAANIDILNSVTVTTSPGGLSIIVDGTTYTAPQTFNWVVGSSHTLNTTSPQAGPAGTQYVFSSWSQGGAQSQSVTALAAATVYTASFTTQYQLTTQAAPSADGSVTPASGSYFASGASIPVAATANAGFQFTNWTTSNGGTFGSTTAASTNFTMPSAATTVTGNFAAIITSTSISVTNVSPSSEVYGLDSSVTITAVLSWTGSGPSPTASDVSIGGTGPSGYSATTCGTPVSDTLTCTATYTPTAADTVGSYTESATFSGDSNYSGSGSSQTNNFSITQASSSTSVGSSQNPSTVGQSVTFTATISGEYGEVKGRNGPLLGGSVSVIKRGAPQRGLTQKGQVHPQVVGGISGTVTWSANTGCSPTTVSGDPGTSQCITTTLPQGTDTITATYSGDGNHSGSTGSLNGGQVVNPATVQITIATSPVNLLVSADGGTPVAAPLIENWLPGSSHTIATTTPQGISGTRYTFSNWSDGGAISHSVTAPATATSYTATFNTLYRLNTNVNPNNGGGTVAPVSGFYAPGAVVPLTATANAGFTFNSWTGNVANPADASTTITMNAPEVVTASFVQTQIKLNPTSISFGTVYLNTHHSQNVTVMNPGTGTLDISGVSLTTTEGAGASFTNLCGSTVAPGKGCTIEVTFTPTEIGGFSATLNVADNAGGSPQQVPITANVINPALSFRPSTLNFGTQTVGSSITKTITLTSTGTTALDISSIAITGADPGDFAQTNTCPSSLTSPNTCTISVTFTPTATGARSAGLTVTDNVGVGQQTLPLSGNGS
jgi:hypothetical protein